MERRCNYRLILLFFVLFFSIVASASPQVTTYQARIVKPDGLPLETANVNFKFSVLNPAADCVLYAETFSAINMANSAGIISFTLGSGVKTFPASATTFAQVFNNSTPVLSCDAGGPPDYSPLSFDVRKVVMQFNDGAGWQTLPAMSINAVPYSIYSGDSLRLGGVSATNYVQYSTIPTCTASQAIRYDGSSFSCVTLASGGGASSTITSGDVTTALGYTPANTSTVGTSFSTVTATLSSLTSSQTTLTSTISTLSASYSALSASMTTFTDSQWTASATDIFYTLGNVGIGTSTPVTKLDVAGGIRISMEPATCAAGLAGTLRYNLGIVEYCNGTSWTAFGVSGAGILAINGLTSGSQTFAMGATGTQPNVSSTGTVHTINIPNAASAAVTAGLLANTDYQIFTNKMNATSAAVISALGYTPASVTAHVMATYQVRVATSGNIALSGNQTIDGISVVAGDRVLVKNQSAQQENGVYVANAGAWTRAADINTWEKTIGYKAHVTEGAAWEGMTFSSNTSVGGTLDSTVFEWSSAGSTNISLNTAQGFSALGANTTGTTNAAYGPGTLALNTTGSANTANGFRALYSNSTGSYNTANGAISLFSNISGSYNTANGYRSLYFNTGSYNTATGYRSLYLNSTGINNTANGYNALTNTTTGSNNTGVGFSAGSAITTGSNNVVIGSNTGSSFATDSNNISISDGAGNERIRVVSSGNVGIGTTTPVTALQVSGGVRISMESAICATSYAGTLRYNSGNVEFCNGASWSAFGVAGAGITNFNGSTSGSQTFANGTTGTAPLFVTTNGVHTLNIPLASAGSVTAGLLSNADYATFMNKMTSSSASIAQALGYTPAASGAIAIADLTDAHTNSNDSIFIGVGTPQSGTTSNNTALGVSALALLTDGSENVAIGKEALYSNTSGYANTAIGWESLFSNTTGGNNTSVGNESMAANTTGYSNSALGSWALYRNTTGSFNVALGEAAIDYNTSGNYNIGIGMTAGRYNTNGNYNTFLGSNAGRGQGTNLSNVSGSTLVGYSAGSNILTGANGNTLLGYKVGDNITTGSKNIVIGYDIDATTATASNTLNIGNLIFGTEVNGVGTAISTGNVGIGITDPKAILHLKAGTTAANTAPLKFTSGTLLTSPESGTVEYDGTNLYFTDSTNIRRTITSTAGAGTYDSASLISNSGNITMYPNSGAGSVIVSATTASTSSNTGALVVKGGVGVTGDINVSGTISATVGLVTPLVVGSNASSGSLTLNSTTHANKGNIYISPQDAGKVAIGNVDPLVGLHVQKPGPLNLVAIFQAGASSGSIALGTNATYPASGGQVQGLDGSGAAGSLVLNAIGGFVGIGTAAPLAPLHIRRPFGSSQSLLLEGDSASTGTPKLTFLDTNGGSTQGHIGFDATNGFSMMGGKVGIGTVSPAGVLEINTPDATPNILLSRTAMATKWAIRNSNNGVSDTLLIGDNANNLSGISIEASGRVGIGLTIPVTQLDVSGAIRISDDQTACSSANKGAMRFNQSTNIFQMCDGISWNTSASADLIPASSVVLMSSCPVGWTNNGLASAAGQGAVTCSGITCSLCQAPSASLVPASSNMLMESCPSGWTTMNKAGGPGRSGYTLSGSIVDFVTCQSPAISSVMPKGSRVIMQFCPAAWNDLGDSGPGQILATCGAIPCRVCEVPGGVANPRVLYGGTASGSAALGAEVSIIGGRGGSTSGQGGQVNIRGGMANDGLGGSVFINAGAASTTTNTSYAGASIYLEAGDGVVSGIGGVISLKAGKSVEGIFEDIHLQSTGGRVGIGTTNPEQRLHVAGNSALLGSLQTNISAYASGGIRLTGNGGASQEAISFWGGNSGGGAAIAFRRDDNLGSYLDFYTDDTGFGNITHAATLNNLGNFGIGTASPTTRLHVANSSTVTNAVATLESTGAGGRPYMKFRGDGADMGYVGYGSTAQPNLILMNYVSGPTYLGTNSVIRMSITSAGSVGIGTQTPENLLDVAGIAQVNYLRVDVSDAISEGGEIQLMGSPTYTNLQLDNFQGNFRIHTLAAGKKMQVLGGTMSVEGASGTNYFAAAVGIGNPSPAVALDVTGDIRGTGTVATWSDLRTKKNIKVIPDSLNKILHLRGVGFDWRTDEFPDKKFKTTPDIGVIAQEVEKVFPEVVKTSSDGYKSVGYAQLVAPLIEAVKELYYKITGVERKIDRTVAAVASIEAKKADKTEVDALKAENAELKSRLDRLEKMMLNQQKSK